MPAEGRTREGGAWYQPFDYSATGAMGDMLMAGATAYAAGNAGLNCRSTGSDLT